MSKNETKVMKNSVGCNFELGSYRFQEYSDDRIHIHDDDNNMLFEYVGKRNFQLAIDEFIKYNPCHNVGAKLVMRGVEFDDPSKKAADIVLTRTDNGWSFCLSPAGDVKDAILIGDKTLMLLRDFVDSF